MVDKCYNVNHDCRWLHLFEGRVQTWGSWGKGETWSGWESKSPYVCMPHNCEICEIKYTVPACSSVVRAQSPQFTRLSSCSLKTTDGRRLMEPQGFTISAPFLLDAFGPPCRVCKSHVFGGEGKYRDLHTKRILSCACCAGKTPGGPDGLLQWGNLAERPRGFCRP